MLAEFEEKQYEQLMNHELCWRFPILYYTPGQVLEGTLGFDAGMWSNNPSLRRFFPDFLPFKNISLRDLANFYNIHSDHFPKIKCNIFVQYKRSDHLKDSRASEWPSWEKPYFRYDINPHQQGELNNLQSRAGSRALVLYAAPAFISLKELWRYKRNTELVDYSNFCEAIKLNSHGRYSFVQPGSFGKAHSEEEHVENKPLEHIIQEKLNLEGHSFKENLMYISKDMSGSFDSNHVLRDLYQETLEAAEEIDQIGIDLLKINIFCMYTNTTMMMLR